MGLFNFKYEVGQALPRVETKVVLEDIKKQNDKFFVTDAHGGLELSVYETPYNDLKDCKGKEIMDLRISQLEEKLGLKYDEHNKFIIIYTGDFHEMIPHYDDQGTRTSLIYLTTDFEGGSTSFPLAGTEHKPQDYRPGHYIHYSSRHIHSFHGGMPVTKGTKVVIVLRSSFEDNINSVILLWEVFCFCYVKFRNLFSKKDMYKNQ
tara:strand:+ start:1500 stop:2114 length:615 start_codon:yes stop_codon:yes gene_type:complete